MQSKIIKKNTAPVKKGRYFDMEQELYETVSSMSESLGVSKTALLNESIRQGLRQAVRVLDKTENR